MANHPQQPNNYDAGQERGEELAELDVKIAERRADNDFQARISRRLEEDAAVLERLKG